MQAVTKCLKSTLLVRIVFVRCMYKLSASSCLLTLASLDPSAHCLEPRFQLYWSDTPGRLKSGLWGTLKRHKSTFQSSHEQVINLLQHHTPNFVILTAMPHFNAVFHSTSVTSSESYKHHSLNVLSDFHGDSHGFRNRSRNVASFPPPPPSSLISLIPTTEVELNDHPTSSPTKVEPYYLESSIISRGTKRRPRPLCIAPWTRASSNSPCENDLKLNLFRSNTVGDDDTITEVDPSSPSHSLYSNSETLTSTTSHNGIGQQAGEEDFSKPLKRSQKALTDLHGLQTSYHVNPFYPPAKQNHITRKPVPPPNTTSRRYYHFSSLPSRRISRPFDIDSPPTSPITHNSNSNSNTTPKPPTPSSPTQKNNNKDATTTLLPSSFMNLDSDDDDDDDNDDVEPDSPHTWFLRSSFTLSSRRRTTTGSGSNGSSTKRRSFRRSLSNATNSLRSAMLCGGG